MKPTYALKLSPDGIGLWHRTAGGWHLVGEAELDDPELSQRLEFLRRTAAELEPSGISSKLVIPNSQILYRTIADPGEDGDGRSAAVLDAMEGATPYPIDQLAIDWQEIDGEKIVLAAVARETLREAEAFAADYRFNAISFVAQPEPDADVSWEPFFGETEGAIDVLPKGERVDRDLTPLPWPNEKPKASDPEPDPEPVSQGAAPAGSPLVLTGEPEPETGEDPGPAAGDDTEPEEKAAAQETEALDEDPVSTNEEAGDTGGDAEFEDTAVIPPVQEPDPDPILIAAQSDGSQQNLTPTPRPLAAISDVGMSSRAQVILGLILIFLAILLWASIFLGGKLVAYLGSVDETRIVAEKTTSQNDRVILDPDGNIAAGVFPTTAQITRPVSDLHSGKNIVGQVATSALVMPTSINTEIAVGNVGVEADKTAQTLARLEIVKGRPAHALEDRPPYLSWVATSHDPTPSVHAQPAPALEQHGVATWLDDIKAAPPVDAKSQFDVATIVLAQALGGNVKVSEMPGRRLISRDVSAFNLGAFNDALRLEETDQVFVRIPGTEVSGPKVRRGSETAVPQIGLQDGAKRVASLPPRQDVRLDLPTPDFLETIVATKWSNGAFDQSRPDVPAIRELPLIASLSPDVLQELTIPDQSDPISDLARLGPEPIPEPEPTPEPDRAVEDAAQEPVEDVIGTPAEQTFVTLRPLLADRPAPPLPEVAADTVATTTEIDTDQAVETALLQNEPDDRELVSDLPARLRPELPKPSGVEGPQNAIAVAALVPRLRPADVGNRTVASASVRTAPRIPSSADVAKQATQTSALKLSRVNLLGIFGSSSNRMALVRMSSGRVLKVKPGDRLDGGRVTAVTASTLKYTKNGKTHTLAMPRG